jgi:D-psicose/D-tagatose/L-ribulose 3-epimerase
MKYGIHQLLFSETFTKQELWIMDLARKLGFDGMEFTLFDPDSLPVAEIKQRSRALGLRLNSGIGLSAEHNLISPEAKTRRRGIEFMKKIIGLSQRIGAENLTGVNYAGWGYLSGKMRTHKEWDWGVEAFREICRFAKENTDVVLCIEPVNRFESHFINIAADAVRFLKDVGAKNARVHLDTFHMIREEDNFTDAVKTCGARLGYIHACENQRGVPGTGLVPWGEFYRGLRSVGYDGWITIESFDPDMENIAKLCCIWRKLADSPEKLASQGLKFLKKVDRKTSSIQGRKTAVISAS